METVAGKGTTYSAPPVRQDGKSVIIAVEGPANRLDFYWAANGSSTWTSEVVAGADPAVTMNDGIENIAAIDYNGNLDFYWQDGDGSYIQEVVATAADL